MPQWTNRFWSFFFVWLIRTITELFVSSILALCITFEEAMCFRVSIDLRKEWRASYSIVSGQVVYCKPIFLFSAIIGSKCSWIHTRCKFEWLVCPDQVRGWIWYIKLFFLIFWDWQEEYNLQRIFRKMKEWYPCQIYYSFFLIN